MSMSPRPFHQVDVFTDTAGFGNPLAVVLEADGLDDVRMQRFAAWTALSETTFLLPPTQPGADYRVRIFTPGGELPFAGHPTLGSCHAWLAAGGRPHTPGEVVQECAAGRVPIRRQAHGRLAFAAPPLRRSDPGARQLAQIAGALGLQPREVHAAQLLDNGPLWLGLLLDSAATVMALSPDHAQLKNLGLKVAVAHVPSGYGAINFIADEQNMPGVVVRAFCAPIGVAEDPVTGSFNASLAQWLIADGLAPRRYVASQGECLGRKGRIHIEQDTDGITWIGGDVAPCIEGTVQFP